MKLLELSLVISLLISLVGCQKSEAPELDFTLDPNVERAEDIEILYSDSSQIKVKITGPTMLSHMDVQNPRQEFPDGLLVHFYDAYGRVTSTLSAKHGWRFQRLDRVTVSDSVVWKSLQNETIETEELIWDERAQRIYTKQFAKITRPEEIIYGYGFEADQDFNNAKINAVTGRIKVDAPTN